MIYLIIIIASYLYKCHKYIYIYAIVWIGLYINPNSDYDNHYIINKNRFINHMLHIEYKLPKY